jgi:TolB-like protein/Tfp pilus assembly protein PilF
MATDSVQRPGLDHDDLLEGWKAIADHLNKTERTVQRWEKTKGLPVRRLKTGAADEQGRVFAYKSELDAWWQELLTTADEGADLPPQPEAGVTNSAVNPSVDQKPPPKPLRRRPKRSPSFWVAVVLGLLLIAVGLRFSWEHINTGKNVHGKVTLAVRPFKNLSSDSSQDFVIAGLTEEMVTRLGQLHSKEMGVVRLTPGYAAATPERLAKDLNADYVLEGSVRKVGDRVAITAQLIQISSQTVVWGHSYERDVKDLLRVQEEVADAITGEVLKNLPHVASPTREVDRRAYLAYLEGRYFWNKRTTESLTRALTLFQQSITFDPTYAPSYAGLADCYELLGSAPYTALRPNEAFPRAEGAAKKALQLDGTLAEAHVSLGYSEMVYEWNFPEAQKELALALQLRPDYATGHQFYAYYLTAIGDLDGAIAERRRALELDPVNPLLTSALGEAFYHDRQFDRTIEQNTKSLELDPSYAIALVNIGLAYEAKGMHAQARDAFQKILNIVPNDEAVLALMGHEYAVSGERAKATRTIFQLKQLSAHTYVPAIYFALIYTGLHDMDNAFQWLDKAYNERCEYLVYLATEPLAEPLRTDRRFPRLLQRVGLKSANVAGASRS